MTEDEQVGQLISEIKPLLKSYRAQQRTAHVENYFGWEIEIWENTLTGDFTIAEISNDEDAFGINEAFTSIEEALEAAIEAIEEEF